jgi:hypothetical protein
VHPLVWLTWAALTPMPALSETMLNASGSAIYEAQSNVYGLAPGSPLPGTTDTRHGDEIATASGNLQTSYDWHQDSVYLDVNGSDVRYDRLTYLDHSEYGFDGGLNWALDGKVLGGTIDISRSRSMVPFFTLIQQQQQLVLMTQQRERATLNFLVTPDWRISADVHKSSVDAPVQSAAGLSNGESGGGLQLTYLRGGNLTGGLAASYSTGDYGGVNTAVAAPYRQESVDLTSTYTVTARTSFTGQVGYTRRTSESDIDTAAGVNGSLNYVRTLTPKTSLNLSVSRNVVTNVTNTGSEVDATAGAGLNYRATYKITLKAAYNWTNRFLPGQGTVIGTNRDDRQQFASFDMNYQWLRWLSIRAYANYQTRSSDAAGADFNGTVYGIAATATWRRP